MKYRIEIAVSIVLLISGAIIYFLPESERLLALVAVTTALIPLSALLLKAHIDGRIVEIKKDVSLIAAKYAEIEMRLLHTSEQVNVVHGGVGIMSRTYRLMDGLDDLAEEHAQDVKKILLDKLELISKGEIPLDQASYFEKIDFLLGEAKERQLKTTKETPIISVVGPS